MTARPQGAYPFMPREPLRFVRKSATWLCAAGFFLFCISMTALREPDLLQQRRREKPYLTRRVYVTVKESPAEAVYTIRDEGPGFDPSKLPDPTDPSNLDRVSGRGLLLIRTFMDRVHHNKTGNEITMVKRRDR